MENDIDQISVEFNDDEISNDSFSDSNLYESVCETHGSSRLPINELVVKHNQELESLEYAVYDNGHHQNNRMDRLRLHWKKIIVIFLLLAITITVAIVFTQPDSQPSYSLPSITGNVSNDNNTTSILTSTAMSTALSTVEPTRPVNEPNESNATSTVFPLEISTTIPKIPVNEPTKSEATTISISTLPVNDYTDWETWSQCSQSCGLGDSIRERRCLRSPCIQSLREAIKCNIRGCEFNNFVHKFTLI